MLCLKERADPVCLLAFAQVTSGATNATSASTTQDRLRYGSLLHIGSIGAAAADSHAAAANAAAQGHGVRGAERHDAAASQDTCTVVTGGEGSTASTQHMTSATLAMPARADTDATMGGPEGVPGDRDSIPLFNPADARASCPPLGSSASQLPIPLHAGPGFKHLSAASHYLRSATAATVRPGLSGSQVRVALVLSSLSVLVPATRR